jgi:glycosyltransferase involved in cell wall biosynthesis
MKLSIIIPAYNEEKRISAVLENYYQFFEEKLKNNFQIIVIPNNCSDNTIEIIKEHCKNKKQIKYFEIKKYSGKGGAVMKGFNEAEGDFIGFVDADRSTSPEEFFKLYSNLENYDGIIGSRRIKGAKIIPKRSFSKRISSLFFNIATKILFRHKYRDTQCGAKLFRKEIAKYFVENSKEKGWIFDVELLNLCKKKNYKILEYPISWKDDEGSHISTIDGIKSLIRMLKYKFTSF